MKIGLIKWFYQSDSVRNKCLGALATTDLSKLDKEQIEGKEGKITEVYNALNLSKTFEDSKRSAIRSTLKQIIRERKALEITFLLDTINKDPNVKTDQAELFSKCLTDEEKNIINEDPSTWTNLLKQYIRCDKTNGQIINVAEVAKKIMKKIEAKLEDTKKLRRDLFEGLSETDMQLITDYIKKPESHTADQNEAMTRFICNPGITNKDTPTEVQKLQEKAKKNPKVLSGFSKTEIQLMNLLFDTNLPTEKEKKRSPYHAWCVLY